MNDLTPLTDEELADQKKKSNHVRSEKLDNATTELLVIGFKIGAGAIVIVVSYVIGLYLYKLTTADDAMAKIEAFGTHVFAAISGYLAHFLKRHNGE